MTSHRSPEHASYHQHLEDAWQPFDPERRQNITCPDLLIREDIRDKKQYRLLIHLGKFLPEDILVEKIVSERKVIIECDHEERRLDGGMNFCHVLRTLEIPEHVDMSSVDTCLSSEGVLTILGKKIKIEGPPVKRKSKVKIKRVKEQPRCLEKETAMMEAAFRNLTSQPGCSFWSDCMDIPQNNCRYGCGEAGPSGTSATARLPTFFGLLPYPNDDYDSD